jgi:octaprenyl-diphosphate synthase
MIRDAIEHGGLERLEEITKAVASLGGLAYTARLAQSEVDQALAALAPLPESAFKEGLSELAKVRSGAQALDFAADSGCSSAW